MDVLLPTTHQISRYSLYRVPSEDLLILLDRKREPSQGDLVIINNGKYEELALYRGQPILGVALLITKYIQAFGATILLVSSNLA